MAAIHDPVVRQELAALIESGDRYRESESRPTLNQYIQAALAFAEVYKAALRREELEKTQWQRDARTATEADASCSS